MCNKITLEKKRQIFIWISFNSDLTYKQFNNEMRLTLTVNNGLSAMCGILLIQDGAYLVVSCEFDHQCVP